MAPMRYSPDGFAIGLALLGIITWFVFPWVAIPTLIAAFGYWATMIVVRWAYARRN